MRAGTQPPEGTWSTRRRQVLLAILVLVATAVALWLPPMPLLEDPAPVGRAEAVNAGTGAAHAVVTGGALETGSS